MKNDQIEIVSWCGLYRSSDSRLLKFHNTRGNPKKAICIKDTNCQKGFGRILKKDEIVIMDGTVSEGGRFQVSIPSQCGFYDYEDFELIEEK